MRRAMVRDEWDRYIPHTCTGKSAPTSAAAVQADTLGSADEIWLAHSLSSTPFGVADGAKQTGVELVVSDTLTEICIRNPDDTNLIGRSAKRGLVAVAIFIPSSQSLRYAGGETQS